MCRSGGGLVRNSEKESVWLIIVVRFEWTRVCTLLLPTGTNIVFRNAINLARNIDKLNEVEEKYNTASEECCAHLNKAWSQRYVSLSI